MSDKEKQAAFAEFLGIRILTPLEEEAVSGGGEHDHDHVGAPFNQHVDHDHA